MNAYMVRVMLSESRWADVKIYADTWSIAQDLGRGQSPIGRAQFLGNVCE